MLRLLFISDFTESFAFNLTKGIVRYSRQGEQWEICRMPPSYMKANGLPETVEWARRWGANAVIGQFNQDDRIDLFKENGIVVVAQDYKKKFTTIPNITGDYFEMGRMAASYFMERGFTNYAFFGFKDVCWSDERMTGFRSTLEQAGFGGSFFSYRMQNIETLWSYERNDLTKWLEMLPKPIAIMACDDNQATNLIHACNAIGIKIPSEVSVIGVDNDEIVCNLNTPSLSSICVNIEEGGYQTAALIDKLVHNPEARFEDIVLKPGRIVSRISTAAFATNDNEIQKAVKYIHQNLHNKITVSDVMGEVALSRRLLERRFKAVTGESIYQYISNLKVKRFAEMLQDTNEQIINIAITLGENDTKSIARKFKAEYGCTPSEWREKSKSI